MNDTIWFEEELLPPVETATETTKMLQTLTLSTLAQEKGLDIAALEKATPQERNAQLEAFSQDKAQGVLRVHRPLARALSRDETQKLPVDQSGLAAGQLTRGPLYLVRLGLEFDIPYAVRQAKWAYRVAWCRANFFAPQGNNHPRVINIFPQRLYEGTPATVHLEVGPELKVGEIGGKLGQVSSDLRVGQVTPVTTGFFGKGEHQPYWELQEKETPIFGTYHFWVVLEQPAGCEAIHLSVIGEGDLRTSLFTIPVGPKKRRWDSRQAINLLDLVA